MNYNFDLKKENTFSQECINMYIGLITIKLEAKCLKTWYITLYK